MTALLVDTPSQSIRRIRINRPAARNAIDADVRADLLRELQAAANDPTVRALIFGSSQGMFCAGGDLPSMVGLSAEDAETRLREGCVITEMIGKFPKPVVAGVERFAVGAGAGIALLADHLILANDAIIGFPFLRLGLGPDWGISASLTWRVGARAAFRMLRDAATVPSTLALQLGLADEVVPPDQLAHRAVEAAQELAELPPNAFARLKAMFRPPNLGDALDQERRAQIESLLGTEFAEGYAAMREKRAANFTASS